jgi:hypothetical protein
MRVTSKDLDDVTDLLTDLLGAAEQNFVNLKLGVTAKVPLDEKHSLLYTKRGSTWGLYIESAEQTQPLHASGRKLRVLASHQLNAMIEALNVEAEKQLKEIQEAIAMVEAILAAFKESHDAS